MSKKESENYLDNLLESISDINKSKQTELDFTPENIFGDEPFGKKKESEFMFGDNPFDEPDNIFEQAKGEKLSADDEFLLEFEKELESDAYKDYFSEFETELEEEKKQELELLTEPDSIPDNLDSILQGIEENSKEVEPVLGMPDPKTESADEVLDSLEKKEKAREELGDAIDLDISDLGDIESIGEEQPLAVTESGEPDLAGTGDLDLMDLLSKTDELSDLSNILKDDEADIPLEEDDSIGKFAESEMNQQEAESADGQTDKGHPKKEGEKKGFLQKLALLFFGEDEDEDETEASKGKAKDAASQKNSAAELSAENAQILAELEGEDAALQDKGKKKKEKAKKEKKKKEKKPKPPKQPKPKKEKKPKEKDNTPPLPKKPVIMIFIMAVSFVILVMVGTSLLNYSMDISTAQELYQKGSYYEGYRQLQGQTVKEGDEALYNQLGVLAAVDSQYQAYLVFAKNGHAARALDSLVCAAGRYDLNMDVAVEYECETQYNALGEQITNALAEYDMTLEEAILIYNQSNRIEYTKALENKLSSLGLE